MFNEPDGCVDYLDDGVDVECSECGTDLDEGYCPNNFCSECYTGFPIITCTIKGKTIKAAIDATDVVQVDCEDDNDEIKTALTMLMENL